MKIRELKFNDVYAAAKILKKLDIQVTENYYNNSKKEDNLSEIFAYAAIGIWVTDFIWTIAGSPKLNNNPEYSQAKGFSIKTIYEPRTHVPMVSLKYNF